MLTNPLTGARFDLTEDYVESLIESLKTVRVEQARANHREATILTAMNDLVGEPDKTRGTLQADGRTHCIKVTRRENIKYAKERGAVHPLKLLLDGNPDLEKMVRIDYSESGAKVRTFLENADKLPAEGNERIKAIAAEIRQTRIVTAGKVGIEIKDLELPQTEVDFGDGED